MGIFSNMFAKPTLEGHELFKGKYHDGNVHCECIMQNGERVFDGPFFYEYKQKNLLSDTLIDRAEGTFSMNRKDGFWKIEHHSEHRDRELTAEFKQGRLEGKVDYKSVETDYMSRTSSSFLSFSVHEGHVIGDIHGSFGGKKFSGFCDDNGCPDGPWTIEIVSSDDTLSHVDCEMWSHGTLMSSYSKMTKTKKQNELHPYIRKTFSEMVNGELIEMLFIVRRGTQFNKIEVPHK